MISGIKAILFDMDGTLVDTEPLYRRFWRTALKEFGRTLTEDMADEMRSLGKPFVYEKFREWFGGEIDYDAVRSRRRIIMGDWMDQNEILAKPGAEAALKGLRKKGLMTAVCTASPLDRTYRELTMAGLDPNWFDELISANMVERGKPAPDVYQFACAKIGADPSACVAVEDSPNGIRSAAAAGCHVVMVPDLTQPTADLLSLLDEVVPSLERLLDIL